MKINTIITTLNKWLGLRMGAMAATLLALLALASIARATSVTNVIYVDGFARVGQLVGTSPDTVNLPGATWIGGVPTNGIVTDGTEAAVTNRLAGNPWANAYLPLQIETGHVYTVSCSLIGNPNDNANTLVMGFANAPGQETAFDSANNGIAFVLSHCSNNGCQFFHNTTGLSAISYGALNASLNYTVTNFSVVLNTATNPLLWSASYYTNGVFAATFGFGNIITEENGTRPGYVGLGESLSARGVFQNFCVTDVVLNATAPTILEQPNSLAAQAGHTATFWVNAYALPDPAYQWVTNSGVGPTNAIVGATSATYTTPPLSAAYSGLNYSVILSTAAGSVTSSPAMLTVNAGTPTVFSATKSAANLTNVVVMFSGPVDPSTSQNPANYALQINGAPSGVSIIGASAGNVPGSVVLQTSTLNTNAGYYLAVQSVQDQVGDTMNTSTNPVLPSGLMVYLRGDSGVQLDANSKVVQWQDQTTNRNNAQQYFGMSVNEASEYIPGPLTRPTVGSIGVNNTPAITFTATSTNFMTVPPAPSLAVNGNQTLYVFANPSSFSLSHAFINENVGNLPAPFDYETTSGGGTIVCQVGDGTFNVNESSGGANLVGTEHTWVRTSLNIATNALAANATPVTNFASYYIDGQPYGSLSLNYAVGAPGPTYADKPLYIGWRQDGPHIASPIMDGQMGEIMIYNTPLPGPDRTNVDNYIGQKYYSFSITANLPSTLTSTNGLTATYAIGANQGPMHFAYQWQESGTNIPGAGSSSYTTPTLNSAASNTTYDVILTLPSGLTYTSIVSTLDVVPAPPFVTSAGIPLWEAANPTNIIVLFDKSVDPVTATTTANYTLNSGSVLSAAIGAEPTKVVLTTTPLSAWNANPGNYSLTVRNVQDLYGSVIVTAASPVALYPVTALWLEANNGVVIDSGSPYAGVDQWNDQSGNGDTMFQSSGAPYEPLFTTNFYSHGLPTVQFSGTNLVQITVNSKLVGISTYMTSANNNNNTFDYPPLEITNDIAVFSVVNVASSAGLGTNAEIVGKTGSANANQPAPYDYYIQGTTNALLLRGNGTNNGSFSATVTNVMSFGTPHVVAVTETGNTVSHYLDTALVGTGPLSGAWNESQDIDQGQSLQIGERGDYVNRLNGSISELILIGQTLDSNDVASLNNYLLSKYTIPTGTNTYAVITQQPTAATNADYNGTLIVPAAATGNPLSLQWYDVNANAALVGQTGPTLTINNILANDSYYLVASNAFDSATSTVVTVTVVSGLPQIDYQPQTPTYTTLGGSVSLSVGAYGAAPLAYQWQFFNGSAWANLANNGGITGSQNATLNIANASQANLGNYQVIVTNLSGSVTSSVASVSIITTLPVAFNNLGSFWTASGGSTFVNGLLTLTTAPVNSVNGGGSYFFNLPLYVGGFQASFTYNAISIDTVPLADGITFCLQDDPRGATNAYGLEGGSLCYLGNTGGNLLAAGNTVTPSVALELNIFPGNGVGGVGYSFDADGGIGPTAAPGSVMNTNNDGSIGPVVVSIIYANGQIALNFSNEVSAATFSTNLYVGDITQVLGTNTAYVGFTGAYGGDHAIQTVTNFTFVSIPPAAIKLSTGNSAISWPGSVLGYTLQQNSSIATNNWLNVTNPVIFTNNLNEVITPTNGSIQFYRLILNP
jgi:hypothetical protein